MKKFVFLFLIIAAPAILQAQALYDSITISRFLIQEKMYGAQWPDTLKAGRYPIYLSGERTIWVRPAKPTNLLPAVISLSNRVKANGTEDVTKCFIPRHSINYYKAGKITRYMLVCFECDGVRFSDDPKNSFVLSVHTREKQMAELKVFFKELL